MNTAPRVSSLDEASPEIVFSEDESFPTVNENNERPGDSDNADSLSQSTVHLNKSPSNNSKIRRPRKTSIKKQKNVNPTKKSSINNKKIIIEETVSSDSSSSDEDTLDNNTFSILSFFKLLTLTYVSPETCLQSLYQGFREYQPQLQHQLVLSKMITKLSKLTLPEKCSDSWKKFIPFLKKQKFCTTLLSKQVTEILMTFANFLHSKCLKENMDSGSSISITETDGNTSMSFTTANLQTVPVDVPSSTVSPLDEDTITTLGTASPSDIPIGDISCSISSRNKQGRYLCKWTPKHTKSHVLKMSIFPYQTIRRVSRKDWWKYSVKDIQTVVTMNPKATSLTPIDIYAMNLLQSHSQEKKVAKTDNRILEEREEPSVYHAFS